MTVLYQSASCEWINVYQPCDNVVGSEDWMCNTCGRKVYSGQCCRLHWRWAGCVSFQNLLHSTWRNLLSHHVALDRQPIPFQCKVTPRFPNAISMLEAEKENSIWKIGTWIWSLRAVHCWLSFAHCRIWSLSEGPGWIPCKINIHLCMLGVNASG